MRSQEIDETITTLEVPKKVWLGLGVGNLHRGVKKHGEIEKYAVDV